MATVDGPGSGWGSARSDPNVVVDPRLSAIHTASGSHGWPGPAPLHAKTSPGGAPAPTANVTDTWKDTA